MTMADLRDPFVRPSRLPVKRRTGARAGLLFPDLKDPFRITAHVQPKNWKVPAVPGDIRDPFAPSLRTARRHKVPTGRCEQPRETDDGVLIQRPSALGKDVKNKGKDRRWGCGRMVPEDLRDPFRRR